jgi:hypothetical protein
MHIRLLDVFGLLSGRLCRHRPWSKPTLEPFVPRRHRKAHEAS